MNTHILRTPTEYSFEKVGIKGRKFPVVDLTNKTGVVIIETDKGHKTTLIEHKCDFIYYILEGSGYFLINNQKEECVEGDLVVIPAGLKFRYVGKIKMLLITTPAFFPEQEESL